MTQLDGASPRDDDGLASEPAYSVVYSGYTSAAQREDVKRDDDVGDEHNYAWIVHWDPGLQPTVTVAVG
jgi:hypothetical protein